MARLIDAFEQFFDSAGNPLSLGKLYFYESGSSTAEKTTYADTNETIANSNPVLLTGDGRAPNIFGGGSYRVILTDNDDVQILQRDPVGGVNEQTFGADWNAEAFYSVGDVARDDDVYWNSLTSDNQNNRPSTDGGTNWEPWPVIQDESVTADKIAGSITDLYADSGAADAYVLTRASTTPPITAYNDGARYSFIPSNPNTGASTADIDGLGVKDIKTAGGDDPVAGQLSSRLTLVYSLASDRLEIESGESGSGLTARVNFDGTTNPPTNRDSFNVSSVVDLAGGQYRINFAAPMANANYSVVGMANNQTVRIRNSVAVTIDYVEVSVKDETGANQDSDYVMIQVSGGMS